MDKILERTSQGAADNSNIMKLCLQFVVNETTCGAIGTLAGACLGAIVGGVEELIDHRKVVD